MYTYVIIVEGHIDGRSARWFEGMQVCPQPTGETEVRGPVVDQAALHGLLTRIRDLGLPLLSVTRLDTARPRDRDEHTRLTDP